jgi:hypothetical protein
MGCRKWLSEREVDFLASFDLAPMLGDLLRHDLANGCNEHLFARRPR